MKRTITVVAVALLAAGGLHAQAPPAPAAFEVASIKRNTSGPNPAGIQVVPNGINILNIHLRAIIQLAYQIPQPSRIVGGPDWLYDDRFDITARTAGPQPLEVTRALLQRLLADRFKLVARKETRPMPGYALERLGNAENRSTPGLRVSTAECGSGPGRGAAAGAPPPCGPRPGGPGRLLLVGVTVQQLTGLLAIVLGQSVVDRTGLTERYDIDLAFAPDRPLPGQSAADFGDRPSLFTAVQEQLGFRLVAAPQLVDVVVVESVEPPTPD